MAVTFDNSACGAVTGGSSVDFSLQVITDQGGKILVVGVDHRNDQNACAVTFAGQSLTLHSRTTGGNNTRAELWYLVGPPTATCVVKVSACGGAHDMTAGAISFYGADQGPSPLRTAASSVVNGLSASVVVTTATGDMVVDVISKNESTNVMTACDAQTQRWQANSNTNRGAGSTRPGVDSSLTMGWSWAGAADANLIGVSIKSGGGAKTTVIWLMFRRVATWLEALFRKWPVLWTPESGRMEWERRGWPTWS